MISVFNGKKFVLGQGIQSEAFIQVQVGLRQYLHLFKNSSYIVFTCIALHMNEAGEAWPSVGTLCRETGRSREAVQEALAYLRTLTINGQRVLGSRQRAGTRGQFSSNVYVLFPPDNCVDPMYDPVADPAADIPLQLPPSPPTPGKPSTVEMGSPTPGKPATVKPATENPATKYNQRLKKNHSIEVEPGGEHAHGTGPVGDTLTPGAPSTGKTEPGDIFATDSADSTDAPVKRKRKAPAVVTLSPAQQTVFDSWYARWPNQVAKQAAIRAWANLNPDDATLSAMVAGMKRWEASKRWADGIYQNPATWLNGREWEDSPVQAKKAGATGSFSNKGKSDALRDTEAEINDVFDSMIGQLTQPTKTAGGMGYGNYGTTGVGEIGGMGAGYGNDPSNGANGASGANSAGCGDFGGGAFGLSGG